MTDEVVVVGDEKNEQGPLKPTDDAKVIAQVMYEGLAHLSESVGLPTEEQAWLAAMCAFIQAPTAATIDEDSLLVMGDRADTVAMMYRERFLREEGEEDEEPLPGTVIEPEKRTKNKKSALDDGEDAPPITLPKRDPKKE